MPEFARLDYGDALKFAEREEVLVHGDQDRCAGSDSRAENWDILRIAANVGREVSRGDRASHPCQEAAQLTNFAFGKLELIAKFAAELLGKEVGNHQFVVRQHVLEKISPWNHRKLTENPRVGGSIPPLATIKSTWACRPNLNNIRGPVRNISIFHSSPLEPVRSNQSSQPLALALITRRGNRRKQRTDLSVVAVGLSEKKDKVVFDFFAGKR
jgi:hypothetical protein